MAKKIIAGAANKSTSMKAQPSNIKRASAEKVAPQPQKFAQDTGYTKKAW